MTSAIPVPPTEAEVRALRDRVYGRPVTDAGWEAVKNRWMIPENIAWLKQHARNTFNHRYHQKSHDH